MPTPSPLTLAVLVGYLRCKHLGLLRLASELGEGSEYLASLVERRRSVRIAAVEKVGRNGGHVARGIALTREALLYGEELILDARLIRDDMVMEFPELQRVPGISALGSFHFTICRSCLVPTYESTKSSGHCSRSWRFFWRMFRESCPGRVSSTMVVRAG